jgi:hypothetical protein
VGPRIWLWPNLLSLDAPLVAVLWQILFIRCFHAAVPASGNALPSVLLVSAVWLIYAADRALDAWRGCGDRPRHEFYRRHWRAILPVWTIVLSATAWLAWTQLPGRTFEHGVWLAAAIVVYFAAVHLSARGSQRKWPKEAAVAVIFALGASLASWTRVETRADVFTVIFFSCLCWINCVAIENWEHGEEHGGEHGPSPYPLGLMAACVGLAAILILHHQRPILASAEASSAAAFVLLDRSRLKFSADALRVLADAALLSPIFFLPLAGTGF